MGICIEEYREIKHSVVDYNFAIDVQLNESFQWCTNGMNGKLWYYLWSNKQ